MIIFKCKMCGGDLNPVEGATTCECEYCGSVQTIPTADNEKKGNLFNRANRLRMAAEYDKAGAVYASITAEFPEEAEAYWGLCLCKYGIEYVEDPATGKKIPTCHRTRSESIMDDPDFEQACENADAIARRVYREEAKAIDRLQQDILSVVANESPYDVFICYKETGEDGERTEDSVLGQDIYDALTAKGLKVFFARITLEDKLGQQYEPYIYAALHSAKVMLAVGTQYEYYDAVWVKNEWARFLDMMKSDKSKALIPCYKGIDAYDMPREFKNLQAQDMGKLGWLQDLTRGVMKLCGVDGEKAEPARHVVQQVVQSGPSVDSLLKRAFAFLEDGAWDSANEYADKVLDMDVEEGRAHLAKLLAELKLNNAEQLKTLGQPFVDMPEYIKARRYEDAAMKALLDEVVQANDNAIANKAEQDRLAAEASETARKEKIAKLSKIRSVATACSQLIEFGNNTVIYISTEQTLCQLKLDEKNGTWRDTTTQLYDRFQQVRYWRNLKSVIRGSFSGPGKPITNFISALRENGTVVTDYSDWNSGGEEKPAQKGPYTFNTSSWRDIEKITYSSYGEYAIGLRSDGSLVWTSNNDLRFLSSFRNVIDIQENVIITEDGGFYEIGLEKSGGPWCATLVCPPEMHAVQKDGCYYQYYLLDDGTKLRANEINKPYEREKKVNGDIAYMTDGGKASAELNIDGVATGRIYIETQNRITGDLQSFSWNNIIGVVRAYDSMILGIQSDGVIQYYAKVTDENKNERILSGTIRNMHLFNSFENLPAERKKARGAAIAALESKISEQNKKMEKLNTECAEIEAESAQLKGLFSMKKRKELSAMLDTVKGNIQTQQKQLDDLLHERKCWDEGRLANED